MDRPIARRCANRLRKQPAVTTVEAVSGPAFYLDYNAGAPLKPVARDAMLASLTVAGNPSSVHGFGRAARKRVEDARAAVAALVGAAPFEVVFTSGATEANNWALRGWPRRRALVSAIEHPSVRAARPDAEPLPVLSCGIVDLAAIERALAADPRPALLAVMAVNNETGVIQPLAEVAALAARHDAVLHVDAVQAAGRIPLEMTGCGITTLSLSAHKLGGPQGVGALVVGGNPGEFQALLRGGGQERGRRAGTENVGAIAGFAAAAGEAATLADVSALRALRDRLEAAVVHALPHSVVIAAASPRVANTSLIALPGVRAETLVVALDLEGYAVSAGAACSSGRVQPSTVLQAMGLPPSLAGAAVRVSVGWQCDEAMVDGFVDAWTRVGRHLLARAGRDDLTATRDVAKQSR